MKLARRFVIAAAIGVLALAGGRVATAQPDEGDDETEMGVDDTGESVEEETETPPAEPEPEPVAEPTPTPAPAPAPPPATTPVTADPPAMRPVGLSMGIGVGYLMPTAVDTPNLASARFRLESGIIIEPRVQLEYASQSYDDGTTSTTDGTTTLGLAGLLLYPMYSRGAFDFLLNGALGVSRVVENPDGDDNDRTYTNFYASWGLGINYWLSCHWSVSFLIQNPLLSYGSTTQQVGAGNETTTSTLSIGADFDPSVSTMIHLYY